ncbi:MAG TPA: hypothetical protein VFD73_18180, partial [Gemmatimonadales bacterium]|nr:hypothetical protein [Gemmatimonadales bacterium]
ASIEGAPPISAEPRGWGISVSNSGDIHLSAVNARCHVVMYALRAGVGGQSALAFGGREFWDTPLPRW